MPDFPGDVPPILPAVCNAIIGLIHELRAQLPKLPIVYLGYHVPNQKSPDAAALS